MAWSDRIEQATGHEDQVLAQLLSIGWSAAIIGSRTLPHGLRSLMAAFLDDYNCPSRLRWLPDILAAATIANRARIVAIDVKDGNADTPNYAIELASLETLELFATAFHTPAVYVFHDWRVYFTRDVRIHARTGPAGDLARGSGVPYVLVPKVHALPFERVFPRAVERF